MMISQYDYKDDDYDVDNTVLFAFTYTLSYKHDYFNYVSGPHVKDDIHEKHFIDPSAHEPALPSKYSYNTCAPMCAVYRNRLIMCVKMLAGLPGNLMMQMWCVTFQFKYIP